MRVIDMLNSSRRMIFENSMEGFEYSSRGSCFLCRFQNQDFVVTAKHVVGDFTPDQIRVLFHQGAREFVPYNAQITISPDGNDDDSDWRDIAIFPLERKMYTDDQFAGQLPYPIPSQRFVWKSGLRGHFIMRGFPHVLSEIDYENGVLREQAVQLEADLVGKATMKHCFQISFRDLSPCSDLNGLSGTPIFWVSENAPYNHRLAGMIVRATHQSGIGYFVDGTVILSALNKATRDCC